MVKEKTKLWKGKIIITNHSTGKKDIFFNIVTNKFYEMVADFMAGTSPDKMSHIAFGDNTTTAAITDTTLGNELFRKVITTTATSGDQIHLQLDIIGTEAVFVWKEIGVFNDSVAGDMTNRANINYTHNVGEFVTIDYYIEKA